MPPVRRTGGSRFGLRRRPHSAERVLKDIRRATRRHFSAEDKIRIVLDALRGETTHGSSYVSGDLAGWLDKQRMDHTRGAPYHPQTQGKIERWHQTLKNRIVLENYYLPGDLEAQIGRFIEYYNHQRYHESLENLTPADVYFGRGQAILQERHRIKQKTIEHRRLLHRKLAA